MAKNCSIVYLDANGNKSADYYGNLHLGEENAKKIYLEKMAGLATTKFQKTDNIMEIIDLSNAMKNSAGKIDYESEELAGLNLIGVTKLLNRSSKDFSASDADGNIKEQKMLKRTAIYRRAASMLHEEGAADKFGIDQIDIDKDRVKISKQPKLLEAAVLELFGEEAALLSIDEVVDQNMPVTQEGEGVIATIKEEWDFKREEGTKVHNIIEKYINARNEAMADEEGDYNVKELKGIALEGETYFEHYDGLLDQIEKFLKNIGPGGKNISFATEVIIKDEELGISGIIDLIAYDDQGTAYIFDFKTKEKGKDHLFDAQFGFKEGVLSELYDNRETDAALQTTLYRIMLERKGINVAPESSVVYIEAEFNKYSDGTMTYEKFNHKKDIRLPFYRKQIREFLLKHSPNKFDINKVAEYEPEKVNSINEAFTHLLGESPFEDTRDIDRLVKRKLSGHFDTDEEGNRYFYNSVTNKKEKLKSTREAQVKQLSDYYRKAKNKNIQLTNNLIKHFNAGKEAEEWSTNNVANEQIEFILRGINKETHTLEKVVNLMDETSDGTPIPDNLLIAIDRRDGTAQIINVENRSQDKLYMLKAIEDETAIKGKTRKKRSSIFGRHFQNDTFKYKFGYDAPEANVENIKLLVAGMVAVELKHKGIITKGVKSIRTGSITGREGEKGSVETPKDVSMTGILKDIGTIKTMLEEKGLMSKSLEKIFSYKNLQEERYKVDYVQKLVDKIAAGDYGLKKKEPQEIYDYYGKYNTEDSKERLKRPQFLRMLLTLHDRIARGLPSMEARAISEEYTVLSKAILQTAELELGIGDYSQALSRDALVRTPDRLANKAMKVLTSKIRNTKLKVGRDLKQFKSKHNELLQDLKKVAPDKKNIFANLWLHDPRKINSNDDINNVSEQFKLKDPDDQNNGLNSAERAYIRFFNEQVLEGWKLTQHPKKYEQIEKGVEWKQGQVPLMRMIRQSKVEAEEKLLKKVRGNLESAQNVKNTRDTFNALKAIIDNRFENQLGSSDIQNHTSRLDMMGIDADGARLTDMTEEDRLETNLEVILHYFMDNNIEAAYYNETLGIYKAMNTLAYLEQHEHFGETGGLRDMMEDFVKLQIYNEVQDEGALAKVTEKLSNVMTDLTLGLSPRQFILEGTTNTLGGLSAVLQQAMAGKANRRFSVASFAKAGALATKYVGQTPLNMSKELKLAESIADFFGLYKADPESFRDISNISTQRGKSVKFYKSTLFHSLNNLPYKFSRHQMFVAELIDKGMYDALSVDKATNQLKYEPWKDERFKGLFTQVNGEWILKERLSKEEKEARLRYDWLVNEAGKDGMLDENGFPTSPLSMKEQMDMLDYSRSIFGSLESDQKVLAHKSAFGRAFLKFKNWAIVKKDNYWTKPDESRTRGKVVPVYEVDENGKEVLDENGDKILIGHDWDNASVEGILNTIGFMAKELKEIYKADGIKGLPQVTKNLNHIQKENLRRLMADLGVLMVFTLLFAWLFSLEWADKGTGKLAAKAMTDALADINIAQLSGTMIDMNPLATYSFVSRAINNLGSFVMESAEGDFGEGTHDLLKTFGIYRNIYPVVTGENVPR